MKVNSEFIIRHHKVGEPQEHTLVFALSDGEIPMIIRINKIDSNDKKYTLYFK